MDQASPALESAKSAVQSLDKKQLDSIKALKNPPSKIKMTLEGVCYALTQKRLQWPEIIKLMVQAGFIKSVIEFNAENLSSETLKTINKEFLENKEWDVKSIASAFGPAGILAQWLESQLSYSIILAKVEPLTNEIKSLKNEALVLENKQITNQQ